ncbi:putative UPF0481 protein At3g02645 isoform X2 [Diospyros lotus]|uniref:putative UPF0481 protein At3g02645 isoform X2 n=1 Tax=Diospyros lotus TaxID=55363 RepID=UPI002250D6A1|nr:putative UPF0481 protein At3g02645 isoform X2 [Diospyros lotus]
MHATLQISPNQTNMSMDRIFNSLSGEELWVEQISEISEKELEFDIGIPVCVFRVPKSLSAFKPAAYSPQLVALGPYHHLRPDLYEMERSKIAAAKRFLKTHRKTLKFKDIVARLHEQEPAIRASYHKYIELNGNTLAWIIAIDGLLLLHIFYQWANGFDVLYSADFASRKLTRDAIYRDIVMLENQIPTVLLREIAKIVFSYSENDYNDVRNLLINSMVCFCEALSPLAISKTTFDKDYQFAHLLDLMYFLLVSESLNRSSEPSKHGRQVEIVVDIGEENRHAAIGFGGKKIDSILKTVTDKSRERILEKLGFYKGSEPNEVREENKVSSVEEITIPSVVELCNAGVKFETTPGGIESVKFDSKKGTFGLPVITLNVNSEVVLRNLVAYEASRAESMSHLVVGLYTDLMNGIIDTADDVRLLREKGIIRGRLRDREVADLFNGMSRSIGKPDHRSVIERTVEEVNRFYNSRPKVKVNNFLKKYVYAFWKVLTFLSTLLVITLLSLESFCNEYGCSRLVGKGSNK